MTDQEKIIDKLRKLNAMADSAKKVGNEEEAQAFAAMVQTLLAKHKLEASDIEWEQRQKEDLVRVTVKIDKKGLMSWEEILAVIVGKACACRVIIYGQVAFFSYIGAQVDAEAARDAFQYLYAAAKHLAEREYVAYFHACKKAGMVERARGYKASWLTGFVHRLQFRYQENEAALRSKCAGTPLMRLTGALDRVNKAVEGMKGREHFTEKMRVDNTRGYLDGQQAANKAHLANDPERRLA